MSLRALRLLPAAMLGMLAVLAFRVEHAWRHLPGDGRAPLAGSLPSAPGVVPAARAAASPARAEPPRPTPPERAEAPRGDAAPAPPDAAERAVLEALRARRAELDARESALAQRELLLAAAERRIAARLEELAALQSRLEAEGRSRDERTEQGWRQLVRTFEAMRPRDAAAIFDDLEMPVLLQVLDRMREARAAPVLGAMRPERARAATAELARHRARPND